MLSLTSLTAAIIGFIQSILFSLLLLSKKKKNLSDWVLLGWFLLFAIHMLLISRINEASVPQVLLVKGIGLLNGPFLFFYTRSVFNIRFSFKDMLHVLPFIVILLVGIPFGLSSNIVFETVLISSKIGALIIYSIHVRLWLKTKLKSLKKIRADNFYLDTKWIKTIATLLFIYASARIIHFLGDFLLDIHFSGFMDLAMYVAIFTVIGFYGLKFKVVYDSEDLSLVQDIPSKNQRKYKNSPLKRNEIIQMKRKIDSYFETSEDYLNPDFNLSQLSERLDIRKHHLSEIINLEMGTNFYDIINAKRIQYAAQRIREQTEAKITFEGLGYDSGFKTKSAFYHHFKHFTGKTPGQYKAHISPD